MIITSRALRIGGTALVVLATGGMLGGLALAYDKYADDTAPEPLDTNCANCHGDFTANPYISLSDGQSWANSLHDVHRGVMLNGDCDVCHSSGGRKPVLLDSSRGGSGIPAISCAGCHARDDGSGSITAAGLRQHHWRTGTTGCVSCHDDSDPANATPVGEDVLPEYYGASAYPFIPTDPCNKQADGFPEDYAGSTLGLDNDGDLDYDETDSDCGAPAGTPGETSGPTIALMTVTAHDKPGGNITISYGQACLSPDHTFEFGLLNQVSAYTYSGQVCSIGDTGSYNWTYGNESVFFLIAGQDGTNVGSYGTTGAGVERPFDPTCGQTQALNDRCD